MNMIGRISMIPMMEKEEAAEFCGYFFIMHIMLILPIMFLVLCNKLEIKPKPET